MIVVELLLAFGESLRKVLCQVETNPTTLSGYDITLRNQGRLFFFSTTAHEHLLTLLSTIIIFIPNIDSLTISDVHENKSDLKEKK